MTSSEAWFLALHPWTGEPRLLLGESPACSLPSFFTLDLVVHWGRDSKANPSWQLLKRNAREHSRDGARQTLPHLKLAWIPNALQDLWYQMDCACTFCAMHNCASFGPGSFGRLHPSCRLWRNKTERAAHGPSPCGKKLHSVSQQAIGNWSMKVAAVALSSEDRVQVMAT